MEVSKKSHKYKTGDKYCQVCVEEKIAIAFYNKFNELLNQRLEILNICRHENVWLLGR